MRAFLLPSRRFLRTGPRAQTRTQHSEPSLPPFFEGAALKCRAIVWHSSPGPSTVFIGGNLLFIANFCPAEWAANGRNSRRTPPCLGSLRPAASRALLFPYLLSYLGLAVLTRLAVPPVLLSPVPQRLHIRKRKSGRGKQVVSPAFPFSPVHIASTCGLLQHTNGISLSLFQAEEK